MIDPIISKSLKKYSSGKKRNNRLKKSDKRSRKKSKSKEIKKDIITKEIEIDTSDSKKIDKFCGYCGKPVTTPFYMNCGKEVKDH